MRATLCLRAAAAVLRSEVELLGKLSVAHQLVNQIWQVCLIENRQTQAWVVFLVYQKNGRKQI